MDKDFRGIFEKNGYVLIGWAEVGIVTIFSNDPITKPEDLKNLRMWIWEGDPTAEAAFAALRIKPIPLSITDVMTSLQTGMINAVYASPLSVMAMQWNTKMKYMFTLPLTTSAGAVVISKKAFDELDEGDRKILLDAGAKDFRALTLQSRKDNDESMEILSKKLTFTNPAGAEAVKQFENAGNEARNALVGKLYPRSLLDKVEKELKSYRAVKSGKTSARQPEKTVKKTAAPVKKAAAK